MLSALWFPRCHRTLFLCAGELPVLFFQEPLCPEPPNRNCEEDSRSFALQKAEEKERVAKAAH